MSEQDTNLQSLARKLDELDAQMKDAVATARRRNRNGRIGSIIAIVLIACYLGFAYARYGHDVNPEIAAAVSQDMLNQYLPEASVQLEQKLKENAPNVIDKVEKQVRAIPDRFAQRLNDETKKQVVQNRPQLEDAMYKSLKTALTQGKDEVGKSQGKTDEERFKSLLQSLAVAYGVEATKAIDEFNGKYASGAADLIVHLDVLASNKALDRDQQLQREMVQKFLVLSNHYAAQSGKVDLTGLNSPAPLPGSN